MGGVLVYESEVLVCCTRTCYDPASHISNLTITTCTDGTTERTEDEGLGANIWCCSASAFCQTGELELSSSSYLCQREIQPGEPVSLERFDLERNMGCQSTIPQAVTKNQPTMRPHVMLARFHL